MYHFVEVIYSELSLSVSQEQKTSGNYRCLGIGTLSRSICRANNIINAHVKYKELESSDHLEQMLKVSNLG